MSECDNKSDDSERSCPACPGAMYQHGAPGVYWCENCEREFWKEGNGWWCCDESGEPELADVRTCERCDDQLTDEPAGSTLCRKCFYRPRKEPVTWFQRLKRWIGRYRSTDS